MKKVYALFPNIINNEDITAFNILFSGFNIPNFRSKSTLINVGFNNSNEEKSAMRTIEILRCHFITAAYLKEYDPLAIGKVIISDDISDFSKVIPINDSIVLQDLIDILPHKLEESSRTVSWFARYLEYPIDNEKARVIRLYNALGTLPCGFQGITSLSETDEDKALLEELIKRKEDFSREDNEEGDYVPNTASISDDKIDKLEKLYIINLKDRGTFHLSSFSTRGRK